MTEQQYLESTLALQSQLYAVARAILRSDFDAADAMQEAMLSGWKHRRSLKDESRFAPWLMRILVNKCRDLQRKQIRQRKLVETAKREYSPPAPNPGLAELVRMLPEKQRLPVLFYYFDGYSQKEIAEILSLEPEQVKTRVRQGREQLRHMLEEGGENA